MILALRSDPVPVQDRPEAEFEVTAQNVARQAATELPPNVDPAQQSAAAGDSLTAESPPRSEAKAQRPEAARLSSTPNAGDRLSSATPSGLDLAPKPAAGSVLSSAAPSPLAVSEDRLEAERLTDQTFEPETLLDLTQAISAPTARQTEPVPLTSPAIAPQSQAVTGETPTGLALRADLAFPSMNGGEIDPQSLTAFAQFQDPGASGQKLRDGLSGLLARLPCARVQLSFNPDTATLELRGHLPEDGMRAPILKALQQEMGRDIQLADEMRLLPSPQCGALSGIADAGLPQSTDQITNPLLVGADAQARVLQYADGEQLVFDLVAPDYPAFIYVDYFDAGGQVLHLAPNEVTPLQESEPKSSLRVGAKDPSDVGLFITVGPPYGQEIAVAFAASHPLFNDAAPRPLSEPAAPYLADLKAAVSRARAEHVDFKGEWVYFLVSTEAP
ncbi:hypothetical protein [Arenibacterium sp. LLYu02]|uniref:hypothetical protein n=1 Tax=Arenibacterium sp. LLYu02 TaxID=3404132 RepID=UPI003B21F310